MNDGDIGILDEMIAVLSEERGENAPVLTDDRKADYFRALCNVRPPAPASPRFLQLQDEYLSGQTRLRGTVDANGLRYDDVGIALWRGDITRLNADAIVNACNCALLGCFVPLHGCIDNIIHSRAGVQVRLDCAAMMRGGREPNGKVRVTRAYNLPCGYIFHTVGPMTNGCPTETDKRDLKGCSESCMKKAREMNLSTIAFCCISTGEYRFPHELAARIAVDTVRECLADGGPRVIFDVYKEEDYDIYSQLLSRCR